MSNELDQVRELRPQVPSPTPQARQAALEQLRAAVAKEAQTTERPLAPTSRRSRRVMAPRLGRVASLGASVAVVVAVVAIALLAHGRTRHLTGAGHGAGARGEILSQGGSVLAVSQAVFDVQIDLAKLPPSATARSQLYRRLAQIVGTPTRPSKCPTRGHLAHRH